MIDLASYYYVHDQMEEALAYFKKAGDYKDYRGFQNLGYIYFYGRKVEKNNELAFKYLTKAFLMGDQASAIKISDMYMNGYYVNKDYSYALNYLEPIYSRGMMDLMAGKGNYLLPEVLIRYGLAYLNGQGFKQDNINSLKNFIVARDLLESQPNKKESTKNMISFCNKYIENINKEVEKSDYEELDFCFEHHAKFSFVKEEENITLKFDFESKELFVSLKNLSSYLIDHMYFEFNNVYDYNKIDYDELRPIDYKLTKNQIKLYDEESTVMHFNFDKYVSSIDVINESKKN
jgi:TPR repeat protein